jgi:hypothetical protein
MSATDRTIKIVKREERETLDEEREKSDARLKTEIQIRREILQTVTSWIERQREAKKELFRLASPGNERGR